MRPQLRMSETDPVIGDPFAVLGQAADGFMDVPTDRMLKLERRVNALESRVLALESRTFWTMLRDWFKGWLDFS